MHMCLSPHTVPTPFQGVVSHSLKTTGLIYQAVLNEQVNSGSARPLPDSMREI